MYFDKNSVVQNSVLHIAVKAKTTNYVVVVLTRLAGPMIWIKYGMSLVLIKALLYLSPHKQAFRYRRMCENYLITTYWQRKNKIFIWMREADRVPH